MYAAQRGRPRVVCGNQQKIVLAREIERDPDMLLVGQPTRGVDIGAIEFIHRRMVALRDSGKAVLLISVELDEICHSPTASS
jgi:simple sugar transport system ATP-binding protein